MLGCWGRVGVWGCQCWGIGVSRCCWGVGVLGSQNVVGVSGCCWGSPGVVGVSGCCQGVVGGSLCWGVLGRGGVGVRWDLSGRCWGVGAWGRRGALWGRRGALWGAVGRCRPPPYQVQAGALQYVHQLLEPRPRREDDPQDVFGAHLGDGQVPPREPALCHGSAPQPGRTTRPRPIQPPPHTAPAPHHSPRPIEPPPHRAPAPYSPRPTSQPPPHTAPAP